MIKMNKAAKLWVVAILVIAIVSGLYIKRGYLFSPSYQKADTAITWIRYFDSIRPDAHNSTIEKFVVRIAQDTNYLIRDSTSNGISFSHNLIRDTFYYTPTDTLVHMCSHADSMLGPSVINDMTKWTGPVRKVTQYLLIPKPWVLIDYNKSQLQAVRGIK